MIGMSTIESIRELDRKGVSIAQIARIEHVSEPTVRKYISMEDLSPKIPVRQTRGSKLDPYKPIIEKWLEDDANVKRKQRHTATRVFNRLKCETDYDGGYTTVQKFVRKWRRARQDISDDYLDQVWSPGEAQVDFGEAQFYLGSTLVTLLYLVVSFPFSNVGLAQLFWGENAECVCQGLKNIFEFIGGVPSRCVFDNATGVGRRVGDAIKTTETFRAFAAHYGFSYTFCNPYSGNEKGNVETKVGFIRRNVFVPVLHISSPQEYNKSLLNECLALSDGKKHYIKESTERELFIEDIVALSALPAKSFKVVKYTKGKTDKYGKIKIDGEHRYPTSPEYGLTQMIIGLGAFDVEIYDEEGTLAATHPRAYGDKPTDIMNPASQLSLLCKKSGGWCNSQMRLSAPGSLRVHIDGLGKRERREALCAIKHAADSYGYNAAISAASEAVQSSGVIPGAMLELTAARMASGGAIDYEKPSDLEIYDMAIANKEKEIIHG